MGNPVDKLLGVPGHGTPHTPWEGARYGRLPYPRQRSRHGGPLGVWGKASVGRLLGGQRLQVSGGRRWRIFREQGSACPDGVR